jgi:hypothetical protein
MARFAIVPGQQFGPIRTYEQARLIPARRSQASEVLQTGAHQRTNAHAVSIHDFKIGDTPNIRAMEGPRPPAGSGGY